MPEQFTKCFFGAQEVPMMAKCIAKLLGNNFEAEKPQNGNKKEKTENGNSGEESKRKLEPKSNGNWIGQFQVNILFFN